MDCKHVVGLSFLRRVVRNGSPVEYLLMEEQKNRWAGGIRSLTMVLSVFASGQVGLQITCRLSVRPGQASVRHTWAS